jgi:hypothetical protein
VKRFAVCLLALLATTQALAAYWKRVAAGDDDDYVIFVDQQSLQRKGDDVEAWFMLDFPETQYTSADHKGFRSVAELNHFNCSDKIKASAVQRLYAENMGRGEVVYEHAVKGPTLMYTEIIPESPGEIKFSFVCNTKASWLKKP